MEAETIIEAFNTFAVDYVVIGAFAAIAQNVPILPTVDIDFYASRDQANIERLSNALGLLNAKIRVADQDEGIAFDPSPDFLRKMQMLNLTCQFGDFDILFEADGIKDFRNLEARSLSILVGTTKTQVASVEDVAQSKRSAGRVKDMKVLHIIEKFLNDRENDRGHGR